MPLISKQNDPDSMAERWSNAIGIPSHSRVIELEDAEMCLSLPPTGEETGFRQRV